MLIFLAIRILGTLIAWSIWWRRRGRARRGLCLSMTFWTAASAVIVAAGGSFWWFLALDTFAGTWLIMAMTPRRPELEALRASEAKFAAAFRHSLDAVLLTSVPAGEILEVNKGFTLMTGIERGDALGRTTLELGLWEDLADRKLLMAELSKSGRIDRMEAIFLGKRRLNGLIWGELVQIQGRTCLLAVVRDITESRQRDEERQRLIEELEAKNRELERFAYTVAHDLRNPLMSIRGFVELARLDLEKSELADIPDHLTRISGGAERLQELLESLLELSKAGKLLESRKEVDLRALTEEALELLAASAQSSGAEIVIADDLPPAYGDKTRLLQVVQNLLSNAFGCVGEVAEPRIEIGASSQDPPVFFVRDNGVGIEKDQLESIFELFESGNKSEGTGIGLALVRQIVEGHGGRVWAESDGLGHGAAFYFSLPR